jgi:UDP-glucose 4-epimerase
LSYDFITVKSKKILVTGGTGYIGSHTVVELLKSGYEVVILDSLANSKIQVLDRIQAISGKQPKFIQGNILDPKCLIDIFQSSKIDSVIHFAGLKSVSESEEFPMRYYENNLAGSINLIKCMLEHKVHNLIFSSSATVYGDPGYARCVESSPTKPVNVYGKSKLLVEEMIHDISKVENEFNFGILRYFNPVGAHESGLIGEDPNGIPNNLLPFVSQVAVGKLSKVRVWGNDYPTLDGTGRRDYIHVLDLAEGHLSALDFIEKNGKSFTVNLGTGNSNSVLEVIKAFESASGLRIPYEFHPRRLGDVAENFADPTLAETLLGWKAKRSLAEMCQDTWRWQAKNPNGY